jgi:hypothetical protein
MTRIPTVKRWRVRVDTGECFEVLAPTRVLAVLNFRHDIGRYGHALKVSFLQQKRRPESGASNRA